MEEKIKGLKKIAGETKNLKGAYSPEYIEVFYDVNTHKAWSEYHYSIGKNEWTEYYDNNILNCGTISEPMNQKEIEEIIENEIMMTNELRRKK